MQMNISTHVGAKKMQKKTNHHASAKQTCPRKCLNRDLKQEPRMDNGNENQENATRKGIKIVVRRLKKYTKIGDA